MCGKETILGALIVVAGFRGVYLLKRLRDERYNVKLVDMASLYGVVWYRGRKLAAEDGLKCAASSQLGFFYKTGSEFKWKDAQRYAHDKDGLRILLNEMDAVLASGLLVVIVSWFAGESAYRAAGALLAMTGVPMTGVPTSSKEPRWESPREGFRGWAPGSNSGGARQYRQHRPPWLPKVSPPGFSKWSAKNSTQESAKETGGGDGRSCHDERYDGKFYNPVGDPLKITNHDSDVLSTLKPVFAGGSVRIRHVVLVMLESYREELFPLQQGSDVHRMIARSHGSKDDDDEVNARLSHLCPIAERITGKSGRWRRGDGTHFGQVPTPEWNDTTQHGFGGINVVGALTTASLSLKSMAAILCGAWPLPVDNFEESEAQSYQPCIPQILNLFNQLKENRSTDDFLEQQWLSAFFQSVTDGYDRQDKFDGKIGFDHIVTRKRLEQDAKGSAVLEKINYFGYPETTLRPHIRDYIEKAQEQRRRMFLSHFTSTTHHPWGVPRAFQSTGYVNTHGAMAWHGDFNGYLNAMRFTDKWLGELLQTFDDYGIADETLFVFVGDHGQAFREDVASKTGTYQNGHISNFRVPITFRHPRIPRVQYNALATSLSILPTILDLLVSTGSLNGRDAAVASDLIQDYEGQSFIRPYKDTHNGRRAWNFGIVNSGASMLSVTSADAPWRLVMPLDQDSRYRFTDLNSDPLELEPLERWSMDELTSEAGSRHGVNASRWAVEAEAVARWWAAERKRLWGYKPGE
ncbi:hypothetical protein CEP54_016184 [Fusarium duplospermum]|uniref:Sulfatase N-terminal domain-containing protein n=1 Tax=Fusarium duplospermum TaxID=1325734 RepID=A0A428NH88_9HYPO|nr:hypothetical protein CEP54_016184 [Fusarium duplospermum]